MLSEYGETLYTELLTATGAGLLLLLLLHFPLYVYLYPEMLSCPDSISCICCQFVSHFPPCILFLLPFSLSQRRSISPIRCPTLVSAIATVVSLCFRQLLLCLFTSLPVCPSSWDLQRQSECRCRPWSWWMEGEVVEEAVEEWEEGEKRLPFPLRSALLSSLSRGRWVWMTHTILGLIHQWVCAHTYAWPQSERFIGWERTCHSRSVPSVFLWVCVCARQRWCHCRS